MADAAFPNCRVLEIQPLRGGLRNANFKLKIDICSGAVVLRIYEHDPSLCQKEIELCALLRRSAPLAEVIHAEPRGVEDLPPFVLMRYVEGISLRDLERSGDAGAIAEAARSAGETLAAIGRHIFPDSGWLAAGPTVTAPLLEGPNPLPRFVDLCLASSGLQQWMDANLRNRTHALVWSRASELAQLAAERNLVHGDFNGSNLLVQCVPDKWCVAAVLDWEFAISGSPLNDAGNFLRYERAEGPLLEPHFSAGYLDAGGRLPHDWRRLAQILDLTAICQRLTRPQPDPEVSKLVEAVRATVG